MRVISALGIMIALAAGPLDRAVEAPRAYNQSLSWTAEVGSPARALVFGEFSQSTSVTRVILEAPGAARVVLTHEDFPSRGMGVSRLTDDSTGWWAELREVSGLSFKDVEESASPWRAVEKWTQREYPVTWTLTGRDFPQFEVEGSTHDSWPVDLFLTRLRSEGASEQVTAHLPLDLGPALSFLAAAESRMREDSEPVSSLVYFRDLIDVLNRLATDREKAGAAARAYRFESGAIRRGLKPADQGDRSFIAKFRSVRAEDPLAGTHVRDVEARALPSTNPEHR